MQKTILLSLFALAPCVAFGQFEVASVKPSHLVQPNGELNRRENITASPGSLTMRNITLKSALQWAYSVKDYQIWGPRWLADERYDISAKAGTAADELQLRKMLRALLTERFKMTVHQESKEIQVYALVAGKNGPKMQAGDPAGESKMQPNGQMLTVKDTSMEELADMLSNAGSRVLDLGVPVIDATGWKGRYSFTVDPQSFFESVRPAVENKLPDPNVLITAVMDLLQSQLGIKVELRKAPADLIVVDRAERVPVEN